MEINNSDKRKQPHSYGHKLKIANSLKGHKHSKKTKEKIGLAHLGMSEPYLGRVSPMLGKKHSKESRKKMSEAHTGERNGFYGKKHTEKTKDEIRMSKKRLIQRINQEMIEFEKQGFRCVPTGGKVIPDFVAVKNDKIFAVEVEYGNPNYSKYTNDIKAYFDDIIWILRKNKNDGNN